MCQWAMPSGMASSWAYAIGQGLGQGGYDGFLTSIQPYQVGDLQAWDEELADFQMADLSVGSHVSLSLRQDA